MSKHLSNAARVGAFLFVLVGFARAQAGMSAHADAEFMKEAAAASMTEVEVGKLAVDKASRPEVKRFAQMMVEDHSKANEELKALAAKKNVALPMEAKPEQKMLKQKLEKLSGPAFDEAYMSAMVADHQTAVALFTKESQMGHDVDARGWAAKTLPTLQTHQAKAKETATK